MEKTGESKLILVVEMTTVTGDFGKILFFLLTLPREGSNHFFPTRDIPLW